MTPKYRSKIAHIRYDYRRYLNKARKEHGHDSIYSLWQEIKIDYPRTSNALLYTALGKVNEARLPTPRTLMLICDYIGVDYENDLVVD